MNRTPQLSPSEMTREDCHSRDTPRKDWTHGAEEAHQLMLRRLKLILEQKNNQQKSVQDAHWEISSDPTETRSGLGSKIQGKGPTVSVVRTFNLTSAANEQPRQSVEVLLVTEEATNKLIKSVVGLAGSRHNQRR